MKPFGALLPFEEAVKTVAENVKAIGRTEIVAIDDAVGRVLAVDVVATQTTPPFDRGGMDGYAVIATDTAGAEQDNPAVLEMIGEIHAGDHPQMTIVPGKCVQIATGAMMPEGADAVVMVEDTDRDGTKISIFKAAGIGLNVGKKGSDITAGEQVLSDGTYLDAGKVGVLASQGFREVTVYEKPRVAVLSSGEEVVELGEELKPGQLYDINSHTVISVVKQSGGIPIRLGIIGDTLEQIEEKLAKALECDLVVVSGGSSVGEKDLISEVVAGWGEILFHGVKIKPGKPTMFAMVKGKPVFGMPGYPTSCLVNSYLFMAPALRKMAGLPEKNTERVEATLGAKTSGTNGRVQFMTVKMEGDKAIPVFTESGAITSIARAVGYIRIEPDIFDVPAGTPVTVTMF